MTSTDGERGGMRVLERGVYRGPHLYSRIPMVRFVLDLRSLEDWPTSRIPDFTDRLLAILPGLRRHGCSLKREGGFVERLRDGTWLGHVTEHVALELQSMAGVRVESGKTRSVRGRPGVYTVMYAYKEEAPGFYAGRLALQLVDSLLPRELQGVEGLDRLFDAREAGHPLDAEFDIERAIRDLERVVRRSGFGPTTGAIVQEAIKRDIPVMRLGDESLVQLGHGKRQQRIRASITGRTSQIAVEAAGRKDLTKLLLDEAGLPVPRGVVVRTADEAVAEAARMRHSVVVKPLDGNHGRGVSIDLKTEEEVRRGFELAAVHGRRVIVEHFYPGHDHRFLVINGEVVAVAERVPAHVVGDGRSTIAELIEVVNRDPRRGDGHENVMTRIKVDEHVRGVLAKAGMALDSVPEAHRTVYLRDTANLSTGGTAVDRSDDVHPENALIARRAALTIGLDVAGVDFIAPDISRSVLETGGGIVEVNAAPGFRMHLQPSEGRPRKVARPVVEMLFPHRTPSRIPIIAITGTNGKSTTTRMVAHIIQSSGCTVGFTSTSGVYINDERVLAADASGPKSARMVLRDPTVDVAVLETARGGMLREGLAFDRCDVGACLNVQPDHLGLKGIDTLEDLAWVKSIVVEAVARDGWSILNADDEHCVRMRRRAGGQLCFFSLNGGDEMSSFLRRHVERGGLAFVREPGPSGGEIVAYENGDRLPFMNAGEIPATLRGAAEFNIANALAAISICYVHGIVPNQMRKALHTFNTSFEQTPGRMNVFDGHGFRVLMDYAHNPAGLTALSATLAKMKPAHGQAIGMVSIPGDRRDEDILEMGGIAAKAFDHLVFREQPDERGRPRGEVMRLLAEGALAAGFPEAAIHRLVREDDAVEACLRAARPGDLVVLLPTEVEKTWKSVLDFDGVHRPFDAAAGASA
jgi:cyanophycin synthetase